MRFDSAQFEAAAGLSKQLLPADQPEIVFSGKSNVGKSSLLNKVMGRKSLARVSSVPGKTITVNFYHLDDCRFVDLPGYGYAKASKLERQRWSQLVEDYFQADRDIRLVIQLLDMRHMPTTDDENMLSFLTEKKIPCVVALTKSDKLNKTERSKMLLDICSVVTGYGAIPVVPFSSLNGEGTQEIRDFIQNSLCK